MNEAEDTCTTRRAVAETKAANAALAGAVPGRDMPGRLTVRALDILFEATHTSEPNWATGRALCHEVAALREAIEKLSTRMGAL